MSGQVRVIGVGTDQGDDGAGLRFARGLRALAPADVEVVEADGEPGRLLDCLTGAGAAVLVDAMRGGAPVGTVRQLGVRWPVRRVRSSTHGGGVVEALGLATALGRLPARVEVYGIEGVAFTPGDEMTPAVAVAADTLARRLAARLGRGPGASRRCA